MLQMRDIDVNKAKAERFDRKRTWEFFRDLGLIDGNFLHARNYSGVNDAWKGEPAYVIGASPSLRHTLKAVGGWEFFRGKHTIGINHMIEDWDGFEWFFFLDKRFLDITSYDLRSYAGTVFAQCTTGLKPSERVKVFYTHKGVPSQRLEDGLYGTLSGVAALNLALISGADPIYLFGMDPGVLPISNENLHWRRGYTGEKPRAHVAEKMTRVMAQFDSFRPYSARLRLATDGGSWMPWMRRDLPAEPVAKEGPAHVHVEPRAARVVHISFSEDIARHADITRWNVLEGVGKRSFHSTRSGAPLPPADVYVAEHFLSTDGYVNGLPDTVKRKTLDIVHTVGCLPKGPFRRVIALTQAWRRWLEAHQAKVDRVILPGIGLEPYKNVTPCYGAKVFGRMTRWNPEKIHPEWNRITKEVLDTVPESRCLMYVVVKDREQDGSRTFLKDPRVTYDQTCKIDMFKGDYLKNLSVYVHANGSFKETLSFAVVEAMAAGLPVVYLSEGTGVIEEVVAGCGVRCETIDQVRGVLIEMLKDEAYRKEYGAMARENAKRFDKNRAVKEFDEEVLLCLRS